MRQGFHPHAERARRWDPGATLDLRFDQVGEADANVLLTLVRDFHREEGRVFDRVSEAAVVQITKCEPFARAWLVRGGDRVVGYVVITLGYSIEYGGRDGFIDDLYLVREARGRGWGPTLLNFTVSQAAGLGIRTLHLAVHADNQNAMRLYRRAAFEEIGRFRPATHSGLAL